MLPVAVVDGVGLVEFAVPKLGVVYQLNGSLKMELLIALRFHFDNIKWDLWIQQ
jgi:hypothetical protein